MRRLLTIGLLLGLAAPVVHAGHAVDRYVGKNAQVQRKQEHLPPAVRDRLWKIAIESPSLDYDALAQRYAKDPLLRGLRAWNADEVGYLRYASRLVPSDKQRQLALAELAARHLDAAAAGDLAGAVRSFAKQHPGVTVESLTALGAKAPSLAAALRRFAAPQKSAKAAKTTLPTAEAIIAARPGLVAELPFTWTQLERTLARPSSPLRARIAAAIAELERRHGNADGRIAPADLAKTKDEVALAVMERVYVRTGRRELGPDELDAALPRAIAEIADANRAVRGPLGALARAVVTEGLADLAAAYEERVIAGSEAITNVIKARSLEHRHWAQIRAAAPGLFPEPSSLPLSGARLDGVARQYARMRDGEMNAVAFYASTKITREELLLLQNSDPRFARPDGTKSWQTVAGSRRADKDEAPAPVPGPIDKAELARVVGEAAMALRERDPLIKVRELVARLGEDPAIQRLLDGRNLSLQRYEALQIAYTEHFPKLKDPARPLAIFAEQIRAILAEEPGLSPRQITERMRRQHPRFKLSRVQQLAKIYPDLIPRSGAVVIPAEQRRADAELVAKKMAESPDATLAAVLEPLRAERPHLGVEYARRLRKDFADVFAAAGQPFQRRAQARPQRVLDETIELAVQLSPPGSPERVVLAAANRLLVEQGLSPLGERFSGGAAIVFKQRYGTIDEQGAATVAELCAEYARAAPRGAGEDEILAHVRKDYPHLDAERLGTYRKLWRKTPTRYPQLASFKKGLHGLGERVAEPRFIGGWDPRRALTPGYRRDAAPDGAKEGRYADGTADIARRVDFLRITHSLPLLDHLLDQLDGKKPFAHQQVLMVSHLLGSTVALTRALAQAGATMKGMIVVGSPYGANDVVAETLRGEGIDVRVPELAESAYRAAVRKAVDDAAAQQRRTQDPFVVLDDGGLVTEILHSDPKYADVLSQFKIVEQTTRGITVAQKLALKTPVINVARSAPKLAEGEIIGRTVAAKVVQGLARAGGALVGKRVVVTGYGTIGAPLCALLAKEGAKVEVIDPAEDAAGRAKADGFRVVSRAALAKADIVVGATGVQSISLDDLGMLKDGAIVASATSKQVEIDMQGLARAASARKDVTPAGTRAKLPNFRYTLSGRRLTLLGDGWPINFDGDVDSAPPEEIQITRAAMFAGALQAASIRGHRSSAQGILPLDEAVGRDLVARFRALQKATPPPPISNPDHWAETLDHLIAVANP